EKEAKKESFRKYLESSGAVDALTKVLVALYEQNDKPSSALEFIQQKLSCPFIHEYEKLQAQSSDLQIRYNDLLASQHCTSPPSSRSDPHPELTTVFLNIRLRLSRIYPSATVNAPPFNHQPLTQLASTTINA
ncbi:hypothetical protein RYX36_018763, partial [Vicia faba]